MIVRLPCFLALRSPLLIASRMEVSPIPVRALASSGDTESRSESGTFPFCPNSFITQAPYRLQATRVWLVSRAFLASLGTAANKECIGKRVIPRMMQLAVPKQNGRQKCVVRLDIKANERRDSRFPISSPLLRVIAATNFWSLGRSPHRCEGDQPLIS